jgi:hypothetical protein
MIDWKLCFELVSIPNARLAFVFGHQSIERISFIYLGTKMSRKKLESKRKEISFAGQAFMAQGCQIFLGK